MASQTTASNSGGGSGGGERLRRDPLGTFFDDDFFNNDGTFNDDVLGSDFGALSPFHICLSGTACSAPTLAFIDKQSVDGKIYCCQKGTVSVSTQNIMGIQLSQCTCAAAGGNGNGNGNSNGNKNNGNDGSRNGDDDSWSSTNPSAVPTPPQMTAKQQWAIDLETLMRSYAAASPQHTLVKCMLGSECGVPSQSQGRPATTTLGPLNSGSFNPNNPFPRTLGVKSLWSWLWIIILLVILAIVFLIVCCCKLKNAGAAGNNTRLSMPQELVIQNSAYEITPAAVGGLALLAAVDNEPTVEDDGGNARTTVHQSPTSIEPPYGAPIIDGSQC